MHGAFYSTSPCCAFKIRAISNVICVVSQERTIDLSTSYPDRRLRREWDAPRLNAPALRLSMSHVLRAFIVDDVDSFLHHLLVWGRAVCILQTFDEVVGFDVLFKVGIIPIGNARNIGVETACSRSNCFRRV